MKNKDFEFDFDNIPQVGSPLYNVMKANGILTLEDRKRYGRYDTDNPGCSREKPILIEETEDYVALEYELLEYLLRPAPYRFVDYVVESQRLLCFEDRALDVLTLQVFTHPLIDMDKNGNWIRQEPVFLGKEDYWFDITAGYKVF